MDVVHVVTDLPQQEIAVGTSADGAVTAQDYFVGKLLDGVDQLATGIVLLTRCESAPGGINFVESKTDELLVGHGRSIMAAVWGLEGRGWAGLGSCRL